MLSTSLVGLGDPCLISLVGASVVLPTWQSHGKAWSEWCMLCENEIILYNKAYLLEVMINYLLQLRERGCLLQLSNIGWRGLGSICFCLAFSGALRHKLGGLLQDDIVVANGALRL